MMLKSLKVAYLASILSNLQILFQLLKVTLFDNALIT